MMAIAWVTGARRSEIAGLVVGDYMVTGEDEGDLVIRGKGDRVRTAYIFDGAAAALNDWFSLRGEAPGPVFCPVWKSGIIRVGKGISTEAMAQMLQKRISQARLDKALTWHDFRRTFAGSLLEAGHDLVTVQKLMGHTTPATTGLYARPGEETKRQAVRSLHVPYRSRL
jgi:site-specific recombinase XerD